MRTSTAFLVAGLALAACKSESSSSGGNAPAESARVSVGGSSALLPLAKQAAADFEAKHPGVTVDVGAGGSKQGLAQAASGAIDVGDSDIPAAPDQSMLVDHKIAVAGFAIVTAQGDHLKGVANLTKQQVSDIFTGKVTNWKDVGGGDQKITVLNRPKSSGTRAVFVTTFLGGTDSLVEGTPVEDNSGTIRSTLGSVKGSVSYLALAYVQPPLTALSVDGVAPTSDNITGGKYPFWSYEHMFTKGAPTGTVKAFLDLVLSPEFQSSAVTKAGYIPVASMSK